MDENVIDNIAERSNMIDLDIDAIKAATGYSEEVVIMGLIHHLQRRFQKTKPRTEYMYLQDFCKYLQKTGTCVNESDIDDYFEIR